MVFYINSLHIVA